MKFLYKLTTSFVIFFIIYHYHHDIQLIKRTVKQYKVTENSNESSLDNRSFETFMKSREIIYDERRQRIQKYCSEQDEKFSRRVFTLLFDPKNGVSMCPVAKISSSTWIKHFAAIGGFKHSSSANMFIYFSYLSEQTSFK